jgi:hypothetical protein
VGVSTGEPGVAGTAGRVGVYYAWSRPAERTAPLGVIENRFPALFESRRMLYPRYRELADPDRFDQGIGGFLEHILSRNFADFVERTRIATGTPVLEAERVAADGTHTPLTREVVSDLDTLIVISFDSTRTGQRADARELDTLRRFLEVPGNLLVVAPHHNIGDDPEVEFRHHGDPTIPPQQRFGGFARSILDSLGIPVDNRYGLRPAASPDGAPAPIEIEHEADRLRLLDGVTTFNLHPHLPHLERVGAAAERLDVLARQPIDPAAPAHPFTASGHTTFNALLQSHPGVFAGDLLIGDATLWSSTAGGIVSLRRLWGNLLTRPSRRDSGKEAYLTNGVSGGHG